jgi:hypothetical protein
MKLVCLVHHHSDQQSCGTSAGRTSIADQSRPPIWTCCQNRLMSRPPSMSDRPRPKRPRRSIASARGRISQAGRIRRAPDRRPNRQRPPCRISRCHASACIYCHSAKQCCGSLGDGRSSGSALHRRLLQSNPTPLGHRLHQPDRDGDESSLTCPSFPVDQRSGFFCDKR